MRAAAGFDVLVGWKGGEQQEWMRNDLGNLDYDGVGYDHGGEI